MEFISVSTGKVRRLDSAWLEDPCAGVRETSGPSELG